MTSDKTISEGTTIEIRNKDCGSNYLLEELKNIRVICLGFIKMKWLRLSFYVIEYFAFYQRTIQPFKRLYMLYMGCNKCSDFKSV